MKRRARSLRQRAVYVVSVMTLIGLPSALPQEASADYLTLINDLPMAMSESSTFWDPRDLPEIGCDDGCAYLIGGQNGQVGPNLEYADRVIRYHPKTNKYVYTNSVIPIPGGGTSYYYKGRASMAIAFDGTFAYLFGGRSCRGEWGGGYGGPGGPVYSCIYASDILRFDPLADQMVQMPTSFSAPMHGATAAWGGDAVYIFSGVNHNGYNQYWTTDIRRYDPATGELSVVGNTVATAVSSISTGSEIYLFGGTTIYKFDPITHQLTYAAALKPSSDPVDKERYLFPTVWDGRHAYMFGGQSLIACCYFDRPTWAVPVAVPQTMNDLSEEIFYYDDVLRFDPATATVERMSARFSFARGVMSAVTDGTKAYVFSGCSYWRCTKNVVKFDLSPGPPESVYAVSGRRSIKITWSPPAPNSHSSPITGYKIYRGSQVDRTPGYRTTVGPDAREYVDTSCPLMYPVCYYWVSATTEQGESKRSLPAAGPNIP